MRFASRSVLTFFSYSRKRSARFSSVCRNASVSTSFFKCNALVFPARAVSPARLSNRFHSSCFFRFLKSCISIARRAVSSSTRFNASARSSVS